MSGADSDPVEVPELGEVVANRLRTAIISGQLPPGSKLVEADLAVRFGVSRGPVREALSLLAYEGLVVTLPRRGSFVCQLSPSEIKELYSVREVLETLALRQASENASDHQLDELRERLALIDEAVSRGDPNSVISADLDLHRAICIAAGNRRLLSLWEQLASQTAVLVAMAAAMDVSLVRGAGGHHEKVVRALIARDYQAATAILLEHFRKAEQLVLAVLAPDEH